MTDATDQMFEGIDEKHLEALLREAAVFGEALLDLAIKTNTHPLAVRASILMLLASFQSAAKRATPPAYPGKPGANHWPSDSKAN